MTNYIFIETSQGDDFRVQELYRTASPKSKPTNLTKIVRLGTASASAIAGLTEDGRLYTSDYLRNSRTVLPGHRDYDDWMVALYRLGKIDEATMNSEIAIHKAALETRSAKTDLECLLRAAEQLKVDLDWNSYADACRKVHMPVHVPEGFKLNGKSKIVKDTKPKDPLPTINPEEWTA